MLKDLREKVFPCKGVHYLIDGKIVRSV